MASSNDAGVAALVVSDRLVPGASQSNEVAWFLTSLNLQQYIRTFVANDIDTMSTLREMQKDDLSMLGVSLGHRLKIFQHIRSGSGSFSESALGSSLVRCNPASASSDEPDADSAVPKSKRQRLNNSCVHEMDIPGSKDSSEIASNSFKSEDKPVSVSNVLASDVSAVSAEHADAMYKRGLQLFKGDGVAQNKAHAASWFHCAAELGHAASMLELGLCFEEGYGVVKDAAAEAVSWYRRAAELGEAGAMRCLALCYRDGTGVEKDLLVAVSMLQRAADLGNTDAMVNLGACYEDGTGVERDAGQAVSWYRRAAELGNSHAMHSLAVCFEDGSGVAQDIVQAMSWYQRSAELDNTGAMHNLGVFFQNGMGVPQDTEKAVGWYRRAAEAGDAESMFQMGQCFANGIGVAKDTVQALSWYQRAAEKGNKLAISKLAAIQFC